MFVGRETRRSTNKFVAPFLKPDAFLRASIFAGGPPLGPDVGVPKVEALLAGFRWCRGPWAPPRPEVAGLISACRCDRWTIFSAVSRERERVCVCMYVCFTDEARLRPMGERKLDRIQSGGPGARSTRPGPTV